MPVDVGNLVELAFAGLFGGGLTELFRAIGRRRRDKTHETVSINDSAMKQVESLQKAADNAQAGEELAWEQLRKTRQDLTRELSQIQSELHRHRQFAELLTYRYRVLVSAIMNPNVSREALMAMAQERGFGDLDVGGLDANQ
jgi:hypothetical protein